MVKLKRLYHELNKVGRDFVVGDIHGCDAVFRAALRSINFDYKVDRMFSVGDLIDRGPSSMDCLQYLYAPWFYAVYANHEDFMLYAQKKPFTSSSVHITGQWLANGGSWHQFEDQQLLDDVCAKIVEEVPYVRVVDTPAGRVNIVHAQILYNHDNKPATDKDIDEWNFHDINESAMIWSRTVFQNRSNIHIPKDREGLSTTYAGHSVTAVPFQKDGHRFIDSGCVYGVLEKEEMWDPYGLTIVDLTNQQVHFTNATTLAHSARPCSEVF